MDLHLIAEASSSGGAASAAQLLATFWHVAQLALGLGFVIFVHELGHFLVAKACGVKCEKFYIGFDAFELKLGPITIPAKLCYFQWGETEYGVGILPLGGYVKMLGQDDNPANAEAEAERTRIRDDENDADRTLVDDETLAPKKGSGKATAVAAKKSTKGEKFAKQEELEKGLAAEGFVSGQSIEAAEQPAATYKLDPRSFPAKNVWQRAAIISAGVIMNVIFAVIFATVAYMLGVSYTPTVIGDTSAGSPAWVEDVQIGDKIVYIGDKKGETLEVNEHLRFTQDVMAEVQFAGGRKEPVKFWIRHDDEAPKQYTLFPTPVGNTNRVATGIAPGGSLEVPAEAPTQKYSPADKVKEQLQGGGKIVALEVAGKTIPIATPREFRAAMAQHASEPVTFVLERKIKPEEGAAPDAPVRTEIVKVPLDPNPMRVTGLVMKIGPVTAIKKGSPAEAAGFHEKDILESINGKPIGDPLTLDTTLKPYWSAEMPEEIEVVVQRKNEKSGELESVTLKVKPRKPTTYSGFTLLPHTPVACESLGIAYRVTNIVAEVLPPLANNPMLAKSSELPQPGDTIATVEFKAADDSRKREIQEKTNGKTSFDLNPKEFDWTSIHSALQYAPPETNLMIRVYREKDKRTHEIVFAPQASTEQFMPIRGVKLVEYSETYKAEDLGQAFQLGLEETGYSLSHVFQVLKGIVFQEISPYDLSGAIGIVRAASGEASVGFGRFLLFLTMLSANLAIVNILPIPVLDGGHLVFIAAEGIMGKPVDENLQGALTLGGLAFILGLMIFVFGLDIMRLFGM